MPSNRINPKTGKRFAWEAEQAAAKAASGHVDPVDNGKLQKTLSLLERQQKALEARDGLVPFMQFVMPDPADPDDISKSVYEPTAFHRSIGKALEEVEAGDTRQLIFCMPPRHGKSIHHEQPILTPNGWTTHGELAVGDYVFGPDGTPTEVIALSADVNEVVPVAFSNGEVVWCHLNHEWAVHDRASRDRGLRVMETRDIMKRALRCGPAHRRGGRWTLQLPLSHAMQFPVRDLPLPPYVLGAWLGDGSADRGQIAHHVDDTEVVEEIEKYGYAPKRRFVQPGTNVHYADFHQLRADLRLLGVLGDKHVPEVYLRASVAQRLELLAGLIDTDGHVERNTGRVRFSTCSERLRDGVVDLATTLGFRPYVVAIEPSTSSSGIVGRKVVYQVGFQPTMQIPCRVPRKQLVRLARQRRIGIVSVGPVEKRGARSICVDRADGLYLVGRTCVTTKNTQLATKGMAAWYSGRHPEHQIAVAAYSDTLASEFGSDTRALIATPQFRQVFPDYKLRRGGNAKDNLETVANGRILFVGRGGALTGRGAHLLLIDDLFKDHEEARSQAIRDQAWNWFTKVAMTRRMGNRLVIITMTRWHSDDVIGRLTDPENPHYNTVEAQKWKIIRLPAVAEDDDPLGREEGAALWPERYDLDFLQSQQRLDPLGFAALYQQRPTVADGILFRRETIQYYRPDELPADLRYYCASDHAVGTNQRNDPSCLLKVGIDRQDNIYVIDAVWKRMPTDVAVEAMLTMAGGKTRPLLWWAERGHISKSIGPFLRKRMHETGTYINLVEVTPSSDKEQRAQSIAARVAMGKVYFPRHLPWAERAINEMLAFPNGNHDDFVDALAYIGLGLRSQFAPSAKPAAKTAPAYGTLAWVKQQSTWDAARRRAASAGGF